MTAGPLVRILPVVWRELLASTRTPATWVVVAAQSALFALYMMVWGDGVPLVDARPVLDQFVTTQWVFLGLALPWAASRCGVTRHRDDVAQLAAFGAVPPSAVVAGLLLALTVMLLAITLGGLPFAILAQQISAAPISRLVAAELSLFALSVFVSATTAACMLMLVNRLFAWVVASAVTLGVLALLPPGLTGGLALLVLGVSTGAWLVVSADGRFCYLSELS
jgi:hypothetical protein